jgi:hypothetical protein
MSDIYRLWVVHSDNQDETPGVVRIRLERWAKGQRSKTEIIREGRIFLDALPQSMRGGWGQVSFNVADAHVEGWKRKIESVDLAALKVADEAYTQSRHTAAQRAASVLDSRGMRPRSAPDRTEDAPW